MRCAALPSGQAATIKCYENNPLVREAVGEPGLGRVLVVDGRDGRNLPFELHILPIPNPQAFCLHV